MTLVDVLLVAAIVCAAVAVGLAFGAVAGFGVGSVLLAGGWYLLGDS